MIISVNNSPFELPMVATVADALRAAGIAAGAGTALAVNMDVIPREQWASHKLNEKDKIMVIRATQGG